MKKITYIISVIALLFAAVSCDKINRGLTELPIDDINPDAYFRTESECQLWLNRCYYNYIVSPASVANRWGDDCINTNPFGIVEGTRLVIDKNDGETAWGFSTIRRINLFLEHSENCEDEAVRLKYEGLARFFRAMGYFEKVRRFGDVPWYDHVVSSTDTTDLYRPRDARGYVVLQILKDLDFAIEHLPAETNVAQATKWTALALKSNVALFEGTWRIYHAADEFAPQNDPVEFDGKPVSLSAEYFLKICVEASREIMKSGNYSIHKSGAEPYREFFNSQVANADEIILAKLYNNTSSELKNFGHNLPYYFVNQNFGFTKRFVNMYLCKNGTRYTDKPDYDKVWYLDEIKDRDPRLSQTIMCPGYKVVGEDTYTFNDFSTTTTGYKPIKWASNTDSYKQNKSIVDLAVYRYAEILLNYAEAQVELNALTTQSQLDSSINLIRSRVDMPKMKIEDFNGTIENVDKYMAQCYPNYILSKSSKKDLVLEIRRERVIELVLEGQHLWDLLRWKEGAQMFDNTFPKYGTASDNGYYGVYFPGFGGADYVTYDMDGDGVDDFEIYKDKPSGKAVKVSKKFGVDIFDESHPLCGGADAECGYVTYYHNRKLYNNWQENRDYLYPVPKPQIDLTRGKLSQNPNW